MPKYSVAVRPTEAEVRKGGFYYDKAYYEDRAENIRAMSAEDAVQIFIQRDQATEDRPDIDIKKGQHFNLQTAEFPFIRARRTDVSSKRIVTVAVIQTYIYDENDDDIESLIQRDLADDIQCSPKSYIVYDAGALMRTKVFTHSPTKDEPYYAPFIEEIDEDILDSNSEICREDIKRSVLQAIGDFKL